MLKKGKKSILALLMFYENRKTMIFKVLGSVIYFIMDDYLFVDYLCLQKGLLPLILLDRYPCPDGVRIVGKWCLYESNTMISPVLHTLNRGQRGTRLCTYLINYSTL